MPFKVIAIPAFWNGTFESSWEITEDLGDGQRRTMSGHIEGHFRFPRIPQDAGDRPCPELFRDFSLINVNVTWHCMQRSGGPQPYSLGFPVEQPARVLDGRWISIHRRQIGYNPPPPRLVTCDYGKTITSTVPFELYDVRELGNGVELRIDLINPGSPPYALFFNRHPDPDCSPDWRGHPHFGYEGALFPFQGRTPLLVTVDKDGKGRLELAHESPTFGLFGNACVTGWTCLSKAHLIVTVQRADAATGPGPAPADAGAPEPALVASPPPPSSPAATRPELLPPPAATQPAVPVLAWYYPQFSQGWATDVANARRAGIDALVVSQTTQRPGSSLFASGIGRASEGTDLQLTLGIETNQVYPDQASLVREVERILRDEAPQPRFLRYRGRPVLVFWALPSVPLEPGQTPQQAWRVIRDQVDPTRTSIWIAEGGDPAPGTGTLSYLDAFDGLHLYSVAWDADPGRALSGWANRVRQYNRQNGADKLWVATVMPGGDWDDLTRSPPVRYHRDREDGAYLGWAWQGAIATNPAMVIVTSFNETSEHTEIHPSPAWGDPNRYLDLNREYGDTWRAMVGAALPPAVAAGG